MKELLVFGAAAWFGFAAVPKPPPASPSADEPVVLCSYFSAPGTKESYCLRRATLPEAQRHCDARLKEKGIEGTCSCTDDASFINGRCG